MKPRFKLMTLQRYVACTVLLLYGVFHFFKGNELNGMIGLLLSFWICPAWDETPRS